MTLPPEQFVALASIAIVNILALLGIAIKAYSDWKKADRKADLEEPKIQADARTSTVTSFANELGINREMVKQLIGRDLEIISLSDQLKKIFIELNTMRVELAGASDRIKVVETENQRLKLGQFHSDERIKFLETENLALKETLAKSDKRIADLETDNKELRRQLEIEKNRNDDQSATHDHDAVKPPTSATATLTLDIPSSAS